MRVHRSFAVLAALVVAALAAPVAQAAAPFTAGTGRDPDVAVAPGGAGHVVWTLDEVRDRVGYCRVPAGGTTCDRRVEIDFPAGASAEENGALVFAPSATKVVIVAGCWDCNGGGTKDRVIRYVSNDGGTSFDGGTEITGPSGFDITGGVGAWLDAENLFVAAGSSRVRAMPPVADLTPTVSGFSTNYGPEVVRVPGQDMLVQAVNDLDVVRFSVYGGPLTADGINTQTSWEGPKDLPAAEPDNDESGLNAGPSGTFLHYRYFIANNTRLGLRRFDPATRTFGAPTYLEGPSAIDDNSLDYPDTFQDASGRVHAVWRTLYSGGRLRYRVSNTSGSAFGPVGTIAGNETFVDPRVAAAADGKGFAVWEGIGASPVRVVALDPIYDSPGSAPGAPSTTKTTNVPGASISFAVPKDCVAPGRTFRVTLKWTRKKRKGNLFVKVRRSDFYVGAKRVKIDARAFIKVKQGRSPKKSIRAGIRVCG